jgi:hypothetical protein
MIAVKFYWRAGAVCCRNAGKCCVGVNMSELLSLLHRLQWSACETRTWTSFTAIFPLALSIGTASRISGQQQYATKVQLPLEANRTNILFSGREHAEGWGSPKRGVRYDRIVGGNCRRFISLLQIRVVRCACAARRPNVFQIKARSPPPSFTLTYEST